MGESVRGTRGNEWFVPKWGPPRFRLLVGMTFWPYVLMNVCYPIIGSLLAPSYSIHAAGLLALVYLLAVGVSAHALDAMSPNRPWGDFLSRNQLLALALAALLPALVLGIFLALTYAILLILVGVFELFFLLAYNLELFGRPFHTELSFSFSWGFLPVIAGYVLQTDSLNSVGIFGGLFGFLTAFLEINASRPYKEMKRLAETQPSPYAARFESILKAVVLSVVTVAVTLFLLRTLM